MNEYKLKYNMMGLQFVSSKYSRKYLCRLRLHWPSPHPELGKLQSPFFLPLLCYFLYLDRCQSLPRTIDKTNVL